MSLQVPGHAWVERLALVKMSTNGNQKNGVCDACKKHLPTLARNNCSNSDFVQDLSLCVMSVGMGPVTWFNPCLNANLDIANLIMWGYFEYSQGYGFFSIEISLKPSDPLLAPQLLV